MNSVEKEAVLHCLKSMIDEEVCEECPLYGTTGTDHCEKDCVRLAIDELEQEQTCVSELVQNAYEDGKKDGYVQAKIEQAPKTVLYSGGEMTEQWQELKETIIEMRDNDGTGTQQEVCKFLANLMDVLEKQMQEPDADWYDVPSDEMTLKQARQAVKDLRKKLTKYLGHSLCEDYISRQAVEEIINDIRDCISVEGYWAILERMKKLPSVSTEKTGNWIIIDDCEKFIAKCSECGRIEDSRMISKYPYCHCGAKMEVEE